MIKQIWMKNKSWNNKKFKKKKINKTNLLLNKDKRRF